MASLIDDMLSGSGDDGSDKPPKRDLGSLLGKAVAGASGSAAPDQAPDLSPLAALTPAQWAVILRYLPSDQVVPLLGGAPLAVASRLVDAFDSEGQAWIAAQGSAIERVAPADHAKAARSLLALVHRLGEEGRLRGGGPPARTSGPEVPPTAEAVAPNDLGLGVSVAVRQMDGPPTAAPLRPRDAAPATAAGGDLVETIAALVAGARGQDPATLRTLAEAVDHPVIATGLRLIADGHDAHALREALHQVESGWLSEQERQLAIIRAGLLSIRFGDDAAAFRRRLG